MKTSNGSHHSWVRIPSSPLKPTPKLPKRSWRGLFFNRNRWDSNPCFAQRNFMGSTLAKRAPPAAKGRTANPIRTPPANKTPRDNSQKTLRTTPVQPMFRAAKLHGFDARKASAARGQRPHGESHPDTSSKQNPAPYHPETYGIPSNPCFAPRNSMGSTLAKQAPPAAKGRTANPSRIPPANKTPLDTTRKPTESHPTHASRSETPWVRRSQSKRRPRPNAARRIPPHRLGTQTHPPPASGPPPPGSRGGPPQSQTATAIPLHRAQQFDHATSPPRRSRPAP